MQTLERPAQDKQQVVCLGADALVGSAGRQRRGAPQEEVQHQQVHARRQARQRRRQERRQLRGLEGTPGLGSAQGQLRGLWKTPGSCSSQDVDAALRVHRSWGVSGGDIAS